MRLKASHFFLFLVLKAGKCLNDGKTATEAPAACPVLAELGEGAGSPQPAAAPGRLRAEATLDVPGRFLESFTCSQSNQAVHTPAGCLLSPRAHQHQPPAHASLCATLWERAGPCGLIGPEDQGVWSEGRSQAAQEEGHNVHF